MLDRLVDHKVTIVGDGCDPSVLEGAGVARADVVVADTGDDEDNLVVVLLATRKSKARCIARVNNPANKLIFESLDPQDPVTVISSTELILDVLNEKVNASKYRAMLETMHLFGKGNMQLVKVEIPAESPVDNKRLAEIEPPAQFRGRRDRPPRQGSRDPDRRLDDSRRRFDDRDREERRGRTNSNAHRRLVPKSS